MSSFPDSFAQLDDDSVPSGEFDSYAPHHFSEPDSVAESPIFQDGSDHSGDGFFSQGQPDTPLSPPIYVGGGEDGSLDGPIFPPPTEMRPEGSFALREWRRQNAARLEEKEKREKELLNQIIDEADEYKIDFYRKRTLICENAKTTNREKEKLLVANLEKFHSEADKNYWKSITELIPSEVPNIEKRGKRDQENKKPSINVVQGPKPGKPTELSRMRQILVKLKQSTPPHLKLSPAPLSTTVDAVVGRAAVTDATKRGAAATTLAPESIAVA